jgi:carbon storage regulator CsrA
MDVVSATEGEILFEDKGIKVTLVAVKENQVSLKVDAPEGVEVIREELLQQLGSWSDK